MKRTFDARSWAPDLTAGVIVLALGLWEAFGNLASGYGNGVSLLVVIGTAAAVALVRWAGWWSLSILWGMLIAQARTTTDLMLVELAIAGVTFGLSRWGSRALLWASGLSIPVATVLGAAYFSALARGFWATRVARNLFILLADNNIAWQLVVLPLIAGVLTLPWIAGLAARYWSAARVSQRSQKDAETAVLVAERERARMAEFAVLREEQARLARDVHDVVGHSLTVILAQAESGQYIADTTALKRAMANIATTARSSLYEVRAVLSPEGAAHLSDLDALIATTLRSGQAIETVTAGTPRPLPPELAAVAFRVLQEMLTNAIKHGRRGGTITVSREWVDRLVISVTNEIAEDQQLIAATGGSGIEGMRRRLESVGGFLDVRPDLDDRAHFTIAASLPLRANRALG
jgi:signal transduction histidine kinase